MAAISNEGQHRAGRVAAVAAPARVDAERTLGRIDSYPYRHRIRDVMSEPAKFAHPDTSVADALALRAAYVAVKSSAMEFARFVRTSEFQRLVVAAGGPEWESWTREWLLKPAFGLGRRPLDIAGEPDGIELLEGHLGRIGNG